jgi:hypothetical protein
MHGRRTFWWPNLIVTLANWRKIVSAFIISHNMEKRRVLYLGNIFSNFQDIQVVPSSGKMMIPIWQLFA